MIASPTRPKRYFYATKVNMLYSFDTLRAIAEKQLGAEIEVGDILICDNARNTKRKVLQMTPRGLMIYYGTLLDGSNFDPLAENNGMIKNPGRALL